MDYIALDVFVDDERQADILTAYLADFPFESFETAEGVLKAYIPAGRLDACRAGVEALLDSEGVARRYTTIETRNWNAPWEQNVPAVDIEGRIGIRTPSQAPPPEGVVDVVIRPCMSFGTGNHATTWLMVRTLTELPLAGRRGLDMGCGTGVLAIAAVRLGAAHVDAVDIDEWAWANCRENAALNGVEELVEVIRGDAQSIGGRRYDFILANINRNTLSEQLPAFAAALREGGDLLMSGFLAKDVSGLVAAAEELGLRHVAGYEKEGWALLHLRRCPPR